MLEKKRPSLFSREMPISQQQIFLDGLHRTVLVAIDKTG